MLTSFVNKELRYECQTCDANPANPCCPFSFSFLLIWQSHWQSHDLWDLLAFVSLASALTQSDFRCVWFRVNNHVSTVIHRERSINLAGSLTKCPTKETESYDFCFKRVPIMAGRSPRHRHGDKLCRAAMLAATFLTACMRPSWIFGPNSLIKAVEDEKLQFFLDFVCGSIRLGGTGRGCHDRCSLLFSEANVSAWSQCWIINDPVIWRCWRMRAHTGSSHQAHAGVTLGNDICGNPVASLRNRERDMVLLYTVQSDEMLCFNTQSFCHHFTVKLLVNASLPLEHLCWKRVSNGCLLLLRDLCWN